MVADSELNVVSRENVSCISLDTAHLFEYRIEFLFSIKGGIYYNLFLPVKKKVIYLIPFFEVILKYFVSNTTCSNSYYGPNN